MSEQRFKKIKENAIKREKLNLELSELNLAFQDDCDRKDDIENILKYVNSIRIYCVNCDYVYQRILPGERGRPVPHVCPDCGAENQ